MRTYSAVKSQVQYFAEDWPAWRWTTMGTWSARSLLLAARSLKSSGWPRLRTLIPAMVISTRDGSNLTPERPAAAKMRPQLGSPPANAVVTRREGAMVSRNFVVVE